MSPEENQEVLGVQQVPVQIIEAEKAYVYDATAEQSVFVEVRGR